MDRSRLQRLQKDALIIAGLAVAYCAAGELGLPVPLGGRKYRALSMLAVLPIALLCALAISYAYTAWPRWVIFLLAPVTVALGVALAIFLVGRALPAKISNREEGND